MTADGALVVDALGVVVSVLAPEPVHAELHSALIDLSSRAPSTRALQLEASADRRYRLLDDGVVALEDIDPAVAAASVVWRLNAIAATAPGHLLLHAGWGAGAVFIPGRSGAGKSTLVAACVEAGLGYLSDEYAVLDLRSGNAVPYPKPIGLEGERLVAGSALRAGSVGAAIGVSAIVFPRYEPDEQTSFTRLDPQWTLAALTAHATSLEALGAPALRRLAGIAAVVPAWQATYSDCRRVVPDMIEVAAAPPVAAPPADVVGPITETTTTMIFGDDLAVFDHPTGEVHILNEAAAFLWTCIPDATDGAGLADVARARVPDRPLAPALVASTVTQLDALGLLPAGWSSSGNG